MKYVIEVNCQFNRSKVFIWTDHGRGIAIDDYCVATMACGYYGA